MRTIRASEISSYLYCQRSWWYQKRGEVSENQGELASGTELHYQHGRAVMVTGCIRFAAYALLLTGIVLLAVYLTSQLL